MNAKDKKHQPMKTYRRRLIREKVLQTLYAYEVSKEPIAFIEEQQLTELKPHHNDFNFAKDLIEKVIQHLDELDGTIKNNVPNWEFERIALIDKIILRMGIAEFAHFPDIPPKVTINEAIEIAKAFSTEKSGKFINGVLDTILDKLRKTNTLTKTGRGLLDATPEPSAKSSVKSSKENE
jgi:N utilization substance protein B